MAESLDVYRQLQDFVHIAIVPRYYELISWRSRMTDLSGMPFLEIAQPHLSQWDKFMKRAFYMCISSAVLFVTSPLLLIAAIGVKLSSPGPVFFRQVRLGRDGARGGPEAPRTATGKPGGRRHREEERPRGAGGAGARRGGEGRRGVSIPQTAS